MTEPNSSATHSSTNSTDLPNPDSLSVSSQGQEPPVPEKVLCQHCLRTATNGIKCKGICVADSDY